MKTLTREQAIKRIYDLSHLKSCEHLTIDFEGASREDRSLHDHFLRVGAARELMAIFDIKEEELK